MYVKCEEVIKFYSSTYETMKLYKDARFMPLNAISFYFYSLKKNEYC
jgi:hypothetical protein